MTNGKKTVINSINWQTTPPLMGCTKRGVWKKEITPIKKVDDSI